MKRRLPLLILVAIVGVACAWWLWPPREPVYQGKPLSFWLNSLDPWEGDTNCAGFVAFQSMGTNAIPFLINALQGSESPFKKFILKFNRWQSLVQLPYRKRERLEAAWALYAMGTNARPALPALTNLLFQTNAIVGAPVALAGIGTEAIPSLLMALTNQNNWIRDSTASGLGWAQANFNLIVPALIERLGDTNAMVRSAAVSAIGQLRAEPAIAVPALRKAFPNQNTLVRNSILVTLGEFGEKAREAVPMITNVLNSGDPALRDYAVFALKEIDPVAADKAGLK